MFDEIDKWFECVIEVAKSNDLPLEIIKKHITRQKICIKIKREKTERHI